VPKVREPVQGGFRGHLIFSMPPPSSGGIALIQTLQTLEHWERSADTVLQDLGHNSADYIHVVAEAMKHAFADRSRFLADADFVAVPVRQLLSPEYAARTAAKIDLTRVANQNAYGRFFNGDDSGTSHISIIDAKGNAVACTETINLEYGSFVVVPEYGIVLNNEMDDFSARPGEPNAFGLLQSEANAIEPGKKPLSSMSPTIAVRDGRAIFASGASGGPRIISATLQVTLNHLMFAMMPDRAVAAQRFHHQWYPNVLRLESGIRKEIELALRQKGHRVETISTSGVNQSVSARAGNLRGASDPRKHGRPAGF
jgi:gamma-glutamyltranspeptidase/glutathione hydrolase